MDGGYLSGDVLWGGFSNENVGALVGRYVCFGAVDFSKSDSMR
jgi:hypothetical protein